ncbi:MAG: succinate dehydrogenase cytochrome b subunit [bacterium]
MEWLGRFIFSSIGKKQLMALTGLLFCLFVAVHLLGNLTMYAGAESFSAYAEGLHSLGLVITAAELLLLFFAAVHVITAAVLVYQNLSARGSRYKVNKSAGGRTWSSRLMPWTGAYLIGFITVHLMNFHFIDREQTEIADVVVNVFSSPAYIIFYVASMIVVALHVRHGFWSAFQTVGANHPNYMPAIQALSVLFALAVALGFGSIPFYVYFDGLGG